MNNRMMSRLTLVTLLGAALTGASLLNVRADDNSWKDDDAEMSYPAPVHYPQAAPGSLDLYHWKDYTETSLKSGSIVEARDRREAKLDKQRKEQLMALNSEDQRILMHRDKDDVWDRWNMLDASPVRYPEAAPGSLNLYHWTDYSETTMAPGSAEFARERMMERMEREQRKEDPYGMAMHRDKNDAWDSWNMMDPAPLRYPEAAPGSLNLYHWTDYTRTTLAPGSVEEARWKQQHEMDKMRKEQMKQSADSSK
jgi:hypothetical protein